MWTLKSVAQARHENACQNDSEGTDHEDHGWSFTINLWVAFPWIIDSRYIVGVASDGTRIPWDVSTNMTVCTEKHIKGREIHEKLGVIDFFPS